MGSVHKIQVGFAWLVSSGNAIPGVRDHANTAGHPLPGRGLGKGREAPVGFGLHADSAMYQCWVWMSLWPDCCVGSPPLSLPPHSRGGGSYISIVGGHWPKMAVHLCVDEWHHVPCISVQQGKHQCYDRWSAQKKCPPLAPSVASMKITATRWLGSMCRRAKWGIWGSAAHLSGATTLECCCCRCTHLVPTSNGVGPWQCPSCQCNNHHSDSHYHTSATPFSSHLCWTFWWHCHSHQPAAPGGLGVAAVGFPCHLNPYLPAPYAKESATISSLGGSDTKWSNRGSPWTEWGGPSHPCLDGKPYSGVSTGSHVRRCPQYHSHQSLTIPTNHAKNPEAASTFPIPQLQAPPRVDPAGLPDEVLWL